MYILPTNNSSENSHLEYGECLDILHNMIVKYIYSYTIIVDGDFNGTLLAAKSRKENPQKQTQKF